MPEWNSADLEALLTLEQVSANHFRSKTGTGRKRAFGGEIMGQALSACLATVEAHLAAHAYQIQFLSPASGEATIDYHVTGVRDGRSFSSRLVEVKQRGELVAHALLSCHTGESGLAHQPNCALKINPEGLETEHAIREAAAAAPGIKWVRQPTLWDMGIDLRPLRPRDYTAPSPDTDNQAFWVRPTNRLPSNPAIRQSYIAYLTDVMLLGATLLPHGMHWSSTSIQEASLAHNIFFHCTPEPDDWMLWDLESPWAGNGRGLATGRLWNRSGKLVASVSQEGLIRLTQKKT